MADPCYFQWVMICRSLTISFILFFLIATPVFAKEEIVKPLVRYGHRGFASKSVKNPYTENTLKSVQAAVKAGAEGVEVDLWVTKDLVPILAHETDLTYRRDKKEPPQTNCEGLIHLSTYSNIQDCQVFPALPHGKRASLTILQELFEYGKPKHLILDLKNDQFDVNRLESIKAVADLVGRYHKKKDAILMLYQPSSVRYARSLGVLAAYKFHSQKEISGQKLIDIVLKSGATHFMPWEAYLTEEEVRVLKTRGIETIPYILSYPSPEIYHKRIAQMRCWGITGLIQNLYREIRDLGILSLWCMS